MKFRMGRVTGCIMAFATVLFLAGRNRVRAGKDRRNECKTNGDKKEITGIIAAMESEIKDIWSRMKVERIDTGAGMKFKQGTIGGRPVIAALSGIGKVNAGVCAQIMISRFGVSQMINTGVAGSLTESLGIGDFVVSTDVLQHDFDVTAAGSRPGEIPLINKVCFSADKKLRDSATAAIRSVVPDALVQEGRICTGDQFITTAEQVRRITDQFGGLCCEMEGGAVAQVCYLNDIPFVVIRTISDSSDGMLNKEVQARVTEKCAEAVLTMVTEM